VGESNLGAVNIVGIDASNLRRGGGVTHLIEVLSAAEPAQHGIEKVVVFGAESTLAQLADRPWLLKRPLAVLEKGLFSRLFWQRFKLTKHLVAEGCTVLFAPGGSFSSQFRPVVTMSRNLLPFEQQEMNRYGVSWMGLKLRLLRLSQSYSMRCADGVIFLTEYAKTKVSMVTGRLPGLITRIPHGVDPRFFVLPKPQLPITSYRDEQPYQLLYVSIVDQYKHQWCVVEAVAELRRKGLPIELKLVGPAYPPALKKLQVAIDRFDPTFRWVKYHGVVSYAELHNIYAKADLGIFASSCENMPNILLETMAAGLPVAASNLGPTPEVLGDAGVYFNPTVPSEITAAIEALLQSAELRAKKASDCHEKASRFSWHMCAHDTFNFLAKVSQHYAN
jgi:glycosyltransferase involved in cell wall biosynthesis